MRLDIDSRVVAPRARAPEMRVQVVRPRWWGDVTGSAAHFGGHVILMTRGTGLRRNESGQRAVARRAGEVRVGVVLEMELPGARRSPYLERELLSALDGVSSLVAMLAGPLLLGTVMAALALRRGEGAYGGRGARAVAARAGDVTVCVVSAWRLMTNGARDGSVRVVRERLGTGRAAHLVRKESS
jgi:hypothetical protein